MDWPEYTIRFELGWNQNHMHTINPYITTHLATEPNESSSLSCPIETISDPRFSTGEGDPRFFKQGLEWFEFPIRNTMWPGTNTKSRSLEVDPKTQVRGWRLFKPFFESELFNFRGEFYENLGKLIKSIPISKFEPPIQQSWIYPFWVNPQNRFFFLMGLFWVSKQTHQKTSLFSGLTCQLKDPISTQSTLHKITHPKVKEV